MNDGSMEWFVLVASEGIYRNPLFTVDTQKGQWCYLALVACLPGWEQRRS